MQTPEYIKSILVPNGSKPKARRVWGIDLELVWLPFYTAANANGDTHIPHDNLGCPLRLVYDADGSVKFTKKGTLVTRVAKELSDAINSAKGDFTAGLLNFANAVIADNPEGYKAQVELSRKAGEPILEKDRLNAANAIRQQVEAAMKAAKAEAAKAEAEAKAEAKTPVKEPVKVA